MRHVRTDGVERARGERPGAAGERRRGQEWRQESQAHPEGDDPSHRSRSTLKFTPRRRGLNSGRPICPSHPSFVPYLSSIPRETFTPGTAVSWGSMNEADIGFVARLLGDPTRAAMCLSLVGGEARPAGELAARAGVSAQTASNHLARLIAGRILRVEQQGRWRYYRLAGAEVGHAVEALAVLAPPLADPVAVNGLDGAGHRLARRGPAMATWRAAWASCSPMPCRPAVDGGGRPELSAHAAGRQALLRALGIEVRERAKQPAARRCLDWTERRPHVAGPVGTALASLALDRGWVRRLRGSRGRGRHVGGARALKKVFNVRWEGRP